jgi:signal transduction histidine kinase
MSSIGSEEPGKTLIRLTKGHADLSFSALGYTLKRAALTAAVVIALVAGVAATSAAAEGRIVPGVDAGLPGGRVNWVSPTGQAWKEGIRPGQLVLALGASDDPDGWSLETTDGHQVFAVRAVFGEEGLRASLPIGIIGLLAGLLAVLFVRSRRRWALPAASVAFGAASAPLAIRGDVELSTAVLGAACLLPAMWLASNLRVAAAWRVMAGALVGAFLLAWALTRLAGADGAAALEQVRGGAAFWITFLLVVRRTIWPTFSGEPMHLIRPTLLDVAVVAALAGVALTLVMVFSAPPFLVAVLLVLAAFALPVVRRRFGASATSFLFADVHDQAAVEATEAERARLARELHDVPLQELAAVIRRLDILPGAEGPNEQLREVVSHLRNVAADLRPPVLDDFGLPAALSYLAEQSSGPALPVVTSIADHTGIGRADRPPADVELALYRIASEAVGNAVRHAKADEIRIAAEIEPGRVVLQVSDDGAGFDPGRVRAEAGRRLGLGTMRRRAEAIDAEISIDGDAGGTAVRVFWQA